MAKERTLDEALDEIEGAVSPLRANFAVFRHFLGQLLRKLPSRGVLRNGGIFPYNNG